MVDQIIRPSALPRRTNPVASEIAPVDNGTSVAGSTLAEIVNAGRPVASRAEAEAGTDAEKAMTPLTVDQKIEYEIGRSLASKAQGDKADSAIQEIVEGANTTVDNTDPQRPIISSSGNPSAGFKTDIVVVDGQTDWRVARNYKTVSDLLADDGSGDMGMGYSGSGANVVVSPGDIVTAQGFRYEVAASDATDAHVETPGGVKMKVIITETGLDPRQIGSPANGVDDDAPYVEKAWTICKTVVLTSGRTWVFASVIGIPNQNLYADSAYQLTGAGANVILDGVSAGDAILTSASAKLDPDSTGNLFTGKVNIFGGINFTQRSQSVLINGDRLYNVRVFGNHFAGVYAIGRSYRARAGHLDGYFQSVFITGNHIVECDWILWGHKGYNVLVSDNMCERCTAGIHLLDANQIFSAHNLRVTDNLYEGGGQFLRVGNTIAGVFTGNYLENNTIGQMATAKCNLDLRYANTQPFDNRGSWYFSGNSFQNAAPSQTTDPSFFDILIDQGIENVVFGGGDWTNSKLTSAAIPNIQGTYNRGAASTPFILPRTTQSAGRDYISSSLNRPLSNYLSGNNFTYMTLQLGSTYVAAAEYRPFTMDLNVKLEGENADGEVFAVASFDAHLLFAPVGSGMFGSTGRSTVWTVDQVVENLMQQPDGFDIDTATGTKTVQMFPVPANFATLGVNRSGTLLNARVAGFVTPTVVGRSGIDRVRTHISGYINGLSRLPGTANHWLRLIN